MENKSNSVVSVSTSPFIEEEVISKLKSIHASLKCQGVEPEKYDNGIFGCGSCSGWSSGKGVCEGTCDN